MPELSLWLENPKSLPVNVLVRDDISINQLKTELLNRSSFLADKGIFGKSLAYDVICVRTGTILKGNAEPISYLVRNGDRFILRQSFCNSLVSLNGETVTQQIGFSTDIFDESSFDSKEDKSISGAFRITGIKPFTLDLREGYPVLAMCVRFTYSGDACADLKVRRDSSGVLLSGRKPIYAKDTYFLIADKNCKFKWESASESNYYLKDLSRIDPAFSKRRLTHYSLEKNIKEYENMIYPVRPFSITGISLDGFDPNNEYPVLAIDIDQFIKENQDTEEVDAVAQQPTSQSLAFFLVGSDYGEFAWIAEDECRLFSTKT